MSEKNPIPKKIRDEILTEACHSCSICGLNIVQVHHIIPIKEGGSNEKENLIAVCPNCHNRIHNTIGEVSKSQLKLYKEKLCFNEGKNNIEFIKGLIYENRKLNWQLPIEIISTAIWMEAEKHINPMTSYEPIWRGNIEELSEKAIYEENTWRYPISLVGTFSEFVPFVNFTKLLPQYLNKVHSDAVGTCRIGDSVIDDQYVGALYLPDEVNGISTQAVPIFYKGSSPLSKTILTGDQVQIKCRVKELEYTWKNIFHPNKLFKFTREDNLEIPFGLEVLEAKKVTMKRDEFIIDAWMLWEFPHYNKYVKIIENLGELLKINNSNVGFDIFMLVIKGKIYQAIQDPTTQKKNYKFFNLIDPKRGLYMDYFKINCLSNENEINQLHFNYPKYIQFSDTKYEYFGNVIDICNGFLENDDLEDKDNKITKFIHKNKKIINYIGQLMPCFQYDQKHPLLNQQFKIRNILKENNLI